MMRRNLAAHLNALASKRIDAGNFSQGERLYAWSARLDPKWSVPWYNLGLHAKNSGRWRESLHYNRRALELEPKDQASLWNLGIAATALHEWGEARRAWRAYGIDIFDGTGEVEMAALTACVRLDPQGCGEVVWGQRLDPARIMVFNVPLPDSRHRYLDVILNDGAANGTRRKDGTEFPVFDELEIWKVSEYSTFRVRLQVPDEASEKRLAELCDLRQLGIEDWSTIRFICAECSRGNPKPHDCKAKPPEDGSKAFGFGAKKREDLEHVLEEWLESCPCSAGPIELLLSANTQ
jgi:hypothetical protein